MSLKGQTIMFLIVKFLTHQRITFLENDVIAKPLLQILYCLLHLVLHTSRWDITIIW